MTGRIAASVAIAALLVAPSAWGQGAPQLPPPPPPSSPPQYTPPPSPPPRGAPPSPPPSRPRAPDREPPNVVVQPAPAPRPRYVPPPPEHVDRDEVPPPHTGFQLAARTGFAVPLGAVTGATGDTLANRTKVQVPLFVEVGAKVTPAIFLGVYAGVAFGGTAKQLHDALGCTAAARSCLASSFRIGVEAQYHFQPAERMDPWVGYGIGFESMAASASGGGPEVGASVSGLEFIRLSGGLDFRLTRTFGIGPSLDFSMGSYTSAHTQGAGTTVDQSITDTALHEWITLGVRGVVFP